MPDYEPTFTYRDIMEKVAFIFRRHDFRCDGPFHFNSRTKTIGWQPEPATGQAAFSIIDVTPYVRLWDVHLWDGLHDEEGLDTKIPSGDPTPIYLGVSYNHIDGGSNGYHRAFWVHHPRHHWESLRVEDHPETPYR